MKICKLKANDWYMMQREKDVWAKFYYDPKDWTSQKAKVLVTSD